MKLGRGKERKTEQREVGVGGWVGKRAKILSLGILQDVKACCLRN
jgi:hypothetical protein